MNHYKHEFGFRWDHSYIQLPSRFYVRQKPTPVKAPELVILNKHLVKELGLHEAALSSSEGVSMLAGNLLPAGAEPISQAYAGHQFGYFTMLGDGRAVLLGEHITPQGKRVDIQFKGSGRTPFSRGGDGRATLGPMLREYIISEAMHGLGIPTSRSLAVVKTGETVMREKELPGAILTRVASSHIRVGTFEFARQWSKLDEFKEFIDYTIDRHFPELIHDEERYIKLFDQVSKRQAFLIVQWQLVGFIHGVMNTDNMTISGETIDYGPCAFMNQYDPKTVFSSIDTHGRYAYGNQPAIGQWNLSRFAGTLLPFFSQNEDEAIEIAKAGLLRYAQLYDQFYLAGMKKKLGLMTDEDQDISLIKQLLSIMEKYQADFTNTFRDLTVDHLTGSVLYESVEFKDWYQEWQERQKRQPHSMKEVKELMLRSNPAIIPRNHLVEEALDEAVEKNNVSVMHKLLAVLKEPFAYTSEQAQLNTLPKPSDTPYRTYCGT